VEPIGVEKYVGLAGERRLGLSWKAEGRGGFQVKAGGRMSWKGGRGGFPRFTLDCSYMRGMKN
jgi:hypothetical protein